MSYYVLKTKDFVTKQTIFLIKKDDIPIDQQKRVIRLNCSTVLKVSGTSGLLEFLAKNTADNTHKQIPYVLKRLTWVQAIETFGFDYHDDTSDSGSEDTSSSGLRCLVRSLRLYKHRRDKLRAIHWGDHSYSI